LVFFFDEAHLLFTDIPPVVLEKIDQVVRLIRSKGVGIYFVTQNPADIPDTILGQLGNRIQHALRAFTPRDQKAVRAAADTFRPNPSLDTREVLTQLEVGEALVSLLDERGQPGMVERVRIVPPRSRIGPITPQERRAWMDQSLVAGIYEKEVDRESAYERLTQAHATATAPAGTPSGGGLFSGLFGGSADSPAPSSRPSSTGRGRAPESLVQALAKSAVRTVGSSIGRELVRGIMGSLFGGRRR
jgi:DNA helicase HerA-like ATPase